AGLVGLEWVGVGGERPRAAVGLVEEVGTGDQKSVLVTEEPALRARGGGLTADQDEERVRPQRLLLAGHAVNELDLLEPAVAPGRLDPGVRAHLDPRVGLAPL